MPWYSPPSRREVSLVLFSLAIFVLFYNLETSFTSTGTAWRSSAVLGSAHWDDIIYGNWTWEEEQVAKNVQKHPVETEGPSDVAVSFQSYVFGSVGVNDGILRWGDNVPTTTAAKHAPGYTVMDNVFVLNGTLFVVTDDPSFPALGAIASSPKDAHSVPQPSDWQVLSSAQANETLGSFGGVIHDVSWLVTDTSPSNYTLFALWRTYSALDHSISPSTLTLPPPRRIFYPYIPTFSDKRPAEGAAIKPRPRSPSGFHPMLAKAAFPTLGLLYAEDWADYALLHVPFLLRRVVVADQGAARRGRAELPPSAVPLVELDAAKGWWEPVRRGVARFLSVPEEAPKAAWLSKPRIVVTYLARQNAVRGARLRKADHVALVRALGELPGGGYEVKVVPSDASWADRMRAIAQSTVVIGVYGEHMADSVYIPPSTRATVMELFPPGVFVPDAAMSIRALGIRYVAWWEARQHPAGALPPAVPPTDEGGEVPIDVGALAQAIKRLA